MNADADEEVLHARYRHLRISGEWFAFSIGMREFLLSGQVELNQACGDAIDGVSFPEVFEGASPLEQVVQPPTEDLIMVNLADQTRKVLATLTPREEKVLRMRFGIGEVGDESGTEFEVTRDRIRKIEAKALATLKRAGKKRRAKRLAALL